MRTLTIIAPNKALPAVEQAGLSSLNEGQSIEYEIESNRGKESAVKLKVK